MGVVEIESNMMEKMADEEAQLASRKDMDSLLEDLGGERAQGDREDTNKEVAKDLKKTESDNGKNDKERVVRGMIGAIPTQSKADKQRAREDSSGDSTAAPEFDPLGGLQSMPSPTPLPHQRERPGAYAERPVRPRVHPRARPANPHNNSPPPPPFHIQLEESSGLAVAKRVDEDEANLPQAHDYELEHQEAAERRRIHKERKRLGTMLLMLGLLLILVTIILLAVLLPGNKDKQQATSDPQEQAPILVPTNAPTMFAETWLGLPDSTLAALADPSSPQAWAYDWVMNDPNRTSYPQWKILQRFALATFYRSTGGQDWFLQKDWLSYEVDECSWYFRNFLSGVEDFFIHEGVDDAESDIEWIVSVCNGNGRYLYLVFTENNLQGTLPPELSLLSDSLLDLDVGTNELLRGSIPSQVGLLTNLRKFYANRNQHTGQIPTQMGRLDRLEVIELGYNPFTGSLPSQMGNLQALSFLSVRQNDQMTGIMPTELYRLTNMVTLYIHGLDLVTEAQLLPDIGRLTKLENLKTYPLPFHTSIPTEIGLLTNMKRLNFWKSHITGSLPSELFLLTNLKRLDIDANDFTGTIATEFGNFPNLTMAWMDGNQFSGSLPGSIFESWGKLTLLAINNNHLEGPLPTQMGLLSSMEKLRLSHNAFVGRIPSELGLLNKVTEVFLHETKLNGTLPETLVDMDALEHLTLSNTSLTGSIPNGLCDRVWDMTYTCNVYHGGTFTICYDTERVNFTCSSTDLCGCDACGECNATTTR